MVKEATTVSRSKNSKAAAPLRKIVEILRVASDAYDSQRVKLECGHEASASSGAIYKARCARCRREQSTAHAQAAGAGPAS
jgi:hypothetical protein